MQTRAPEPTLTTGIIAGPIVLAAAAEGQAAAPPEWIKITPAGRATTRDGRSFTFDPAALASRFAADGIDLSVDTNHSVALLASKGQKPDVVGWIKAVEARADGTYGRVAWDDPATAPATLKTHRYVSPTMHHDADGRVTWLHSVALVSAPALGNMPALAHAHEGSSMKQIAKALGLAEDATEQACLAAIGALSPVKPLAAALGLPATADAPACLAAVTSLRAGGNALVTELQSQVSTLSGEVQTTRKTLRDRDVAELLDGALRDRKIVPAQRESYAAMCATDGGLAGVRQLLAATPAALAPSGLDGRAVPAADGASDVATLMAKARKIEADARAAGETISWADAVTRAEHQKG